MAKLGPIKIHTTGTWQDRLANVRINSRKTTKRLQIAEMHDKEITIACYGPSLTRHLNCVRGDLMTVGGAHDLFAWPKYHVECDARRDRLPYVQNMHAGTEYLLASSCHPDVVDAVLPQLTLWHIWNDEADDNWVNANEPDYWTVKAGSTVGLNAMMIAYILGYRTMHILGMDSSCDDDGMRHAGVHHGDTQDVIRVKCNDKWFNTTPQMVSAAREYFPLMNVMAGVSATLYGEGLLQTMAAQVVELSTPKTPLKPVWEGASNE